jgi:hypothetical protein
MKTQLFAHEADSIIENIKRANAPINPYAFKNDKKNEEKVAANVFVNTWYSWICQNSELRDFKASCEKYGILPGVYIGTRWNAFYGVYDFKVNGNNQFAKNRQQYYNNIVEKIAGKIGKSGEIPQQACSDELFRRGVY